MSSNSSIATFPVADLAVGDRQLRLETPCLNAYLSSRNHFIRSSMVENAAFSLSACLTSSPLTKEHAYSRKLGH